MAFHSGGSVGGPTGRGKIWGSWWIPALRSPFREGAKVRDNVTGAMIKGDYSHWDTSLRRPLTVWPEEIKVPAAQPLPDTPVISKVGTLSNQLRIVSFNRKSTLASVGLYLPAGSRYDHPHFLGTTHFLKHMAFQANWSPGPLYRSAVEFIREFEQLGATFNCEIDREHIAFTSEMFADDAARLLPVLAGTLTPSLEEWQVNDQREKVLRESEALENTPQAQVVEALHREAFRAQPLGRPLYCPSYNVHRITESVLQAYAAEHYVPRDALLVGVGFEHEELMGLAERAFGGVVARSEKTGAPASKYVGGGEVVMPGEPTHGVHVAIAYEGVPRGSPDEPALQVLQQVLGRSVRRTLGKLPPGHGTTNRLAEGLLVRHPSVEAASAFSYSYDSTGLFGVYAQGSRPDLLPALAAELSALRSLSDEEVETAKRRARAHLLFGLEYRGTFLDWVASRALRGLDLLAPEQLAASIDQLPPQRVRSLAERILSGRPTLAAFGDVANLPRL